MAVKHGEFRTDITLLDIIVALHEGQYDMGVKAGFDAVVARARDLGPSGLVDYAKAYIEGIISDKVDDTYSNSDFDLAPLEEIVKEILGE